MDVEAVPDRSSLNPCGLSGPHHRPEPDRRPRRDFPPRLIAENSTGRLGQASEVFCSRGRVGPRRCLPCYTLRRSSLRSRHYRSGTRYQAHDTHGRPKPFGVGETSPSHLIATTASLSGSHSLVRGKTDGMHRAAGASARARASSATRTISSHRERLLTRGMGRAAPKSRRMHGTGLSFPPPREAAACQCSKYVP